MKRVETEPEALIFKVPLEPTLFARGYEPSPFISSLPIDLWPRIFRSIGDGLWVLAHVSKYMFQLVLDVLDNPHEFYQQIHTNFIIHIAKYGYANLLDWTMGPHGLHCSTNLLCLEGSTRRNDFLIRRFSESIARQYDPSGIKITPVIMEYACFPLHCPQDGSSRFEFIKRVLPWICDFRQFFYVLSCVSAELGDLDMAKYALSSSLSYPKLKIGDFRARRIEVGSRVTKNPDILQDARYHKSILMTQQFHHFLAFAITIGGNMEILEFAERTIDSLHDVITYIPSLVECACYSGNINMLEFRNFEYIQGEVIEGFHRVHIVVNAALSGHIHILELIRSNAIYESMLSENTRKIIDNAFQSNTPKVIDWILDNFPDDRNDPNVIEKRKFINPIREQEAIRNDNLDIIKWLDKKYPYPRSYNCEVLDSILPIGLDTSLFWDAIYNDSINICEWCIEEKFEWPPFAIIYKIVYSNNLSTSVRKLIQSGCPDVITPLFRLVSYDCSYLEKYCTKLGLVLTSVEETNKYRNDLAEYASTFPTNIWITKIQQFLILGQAKHFGFVSTNKSHVQVLLYQLHSE